jgi:hydrogenase expression/formation protein HypE
MAEHPVDPGNHIVLAHGGGGALSRSLITDLILPALDGGEGPLPDAADVPRGHDLVMTTDAFVVRPLFFRGGDIGSMAVHGTVNDLAVSGAEPLALTMALILEEGLPLETLRRVVASAAQAARNSGVHIIAGDTKVVARGEADELFITTTGVGRRHLRVDPTRIREGDAVVLSGTIGDHGVAVMSERKGIQFETEVRSDSAPVWPLVQALFAAGVPVHAMRDPTRGGLAATCVEMAEDAGLTVELEEEALPVRSAVRAACGLLGLDPLTIANEGKLVAFVPDAAREAALGVLRGAPGGEGAVCVGRVTARGRVPCVLRTPYGGERIVDLPYGEDLPRIC